MNRIFGAIKRITDYMYWCSAVALVCIMFLTVSDVILRVVYRPIVGTFDLTIILGGIVAGFAIPFTTLKRAHVYMGFFVDAASVRWRKILMPISQCFSMLLFLMLGWNLISYGMRIYEAGERSLTIRLPLHPFIFSMGVACLFNCLVILVQTIEVAVKGENV